MKKTNWFVDHKWLENCFHKNQTNQSVTLNECQISCVKAACTFKNKGPLMAYGSMKNGSL